MDAYQCMAPNRNPFEREPHRRSCSSTSLQHLPDAWKAAGMDVPLAPVPLAPVEQLVHTARADDFRGVIDLSCHGENYISDKCGLPHMRTGREETQRLFAKDWRSEVEDHISKQRP